MVEATSDPDCIFLKYTHIRGCLSGIQKFRFASLKKLHNRIRVGRDPTHSLQIVERHTLTGKQHANVTAHHAHLFAALDRIAVFAEKFHFSPGIQ